MTEKIASDPSESREDFIKRVQAEGFEVHFPGPLELFIDIDNERQYKTYKVCLEVMRRNMGGVPFESSIKETSSKSGLPCRHVRIQLPEEMFGSALSPLERIAWQAAFGSDAVREMLSMIRFYNSDSHPTLFSEKPALPGPVKKSLIKRRK